MTLVLCARAHQKTSRNTFYFLNNLLRKNRKLTNQKPRARGKSTEIHHGKSSIRLFD